MQKILKEMNISADFSGFDKYSEMLLSANEVMNLTAITDPEEVKIRHFADSLSLLSCYDFSDKKVIDVGCGAGFPGLPLKLGEKSIKLTLLDSLGKRIDFLTDVCSSLSLSDVECIHARAEEKAKEAGYRESYDIAVSRAVAELSMLSELTLPYVKVGGVFIAMKAQNCEEELKCAENAIKTLGGEVREIKEYTLYGTDIIHKAIIIKKTSQTPGKYPRRFAKIKSQPIK